MNEHQAKSRRPEKSAAEERFRTRRIRDISMALHGLNYFGDSYSGLGSDVDATTK